jgi:hypothetical protein
MDIALWNQTDRLDDEDGQLIADACDLQMREDVAPAYRLQPPPRISFFPKSSKVEGLPGNSLVIIFSDNVHTTENAVAGQVPPRATILDRDDNGRNYGRVYVETILNDADGELLTGARSVSAATSHECIESVYDPDARMWVWSGQTLVAAEVCDQVEEDAYTKNLRGRDVSVSNFVFPEWFDPRAPAASRFDYMRCLSGPFTFSEGGYIIIYDEQRRIGERVRPEPPQVVDGPWGWRVKDKPEGFARTRVRVVW